MARFLAVGDLPVTTSDATRALPPGTTLREARPADAGALAEVFVGAWRACYEGVVFDEVLEATDVETMRRRFSDLLVPGPETTLLLEDEAGSVLAFCRFGSDPEDRSRGHVHSLYSAPHAMRRGCASALLAEAIARLSARGHHGVSLWVFAANEGARRLYRSFGFADSGVRRIEAEYGAEELLLVRELADPPAR